MKNPLQYQSTEYDCGPSSVINAVSFLFEREEIPPELIINVMRFCLDRSGSDGSPGKGGTSCAAMRSLCGWLNEFAAVRKFPIFTRYLSGENVSMNEDADIVKALRQGGTAVVRLYYDVQHYVLLTGEKDGKIFVFDSYFVDKNFSLENVVIDLDHPFTYNRIVPADSFNRETHDPYALGEISSREAVLIFKTAKKLK